jgi:hypothetical protein
MNLKNQNRYEMDSWVNEEELPVSAALKVIRTSDPDYGLSDDEIKDRYEFIRCYLMQDFELLMMIPEPMPENDFFFVDCCVTDPEYSAFSTHDFQKSLRPFSQYGYEMKKIMEQVKDLAIIHSCISWPENRQQVYEQFKSFMAIKFTNELEELAWELHVKTSSSEQARIKRRIETLSREIRRCVKIWEQYAPWDT